MAIVAATAISVLDFWIKSESSAVFEAAALLPADGPDTTSQAIRTLAATGHYRSTATSSNSTPDHIAASHPRQLLQTMGFDRAVKPKVRVTTPTMMKPPRPGRVYYGCLHCRHNNCVAATSPLEQSRVMVVGNCRGSQP